MNDAPLVPLLEKVAVFGDLVLALVGGEQVVRVDVLEADEGAHHARALRLVDEVRDPVAERVDLDREVGLQAFLLAQLDQPVEEGLPVLVAGEVVVGDEEGLDALREVFADDVLEVVGGAERGSCAPGR